ncbi:pentatricopeptide repeat-containing protein At1g71210, mitochondrial [Euphorbia lathyris]|uniref:pentatricopeptide repeat-containing protein At1g71210, mitochondrial n=1 Tax=Euphorbia lathyris TaxID=212925 RepID=UPI0033140BA9
MLSIVQATKSRRTRATLFNNVIIISFPSPPPPSTNAINPPIHHHPLFYYSTASTIPIQQLNFNPTSTSQQHIVQSFKEWFQLPRNDFMDRIFQILGAKDQVDDVALSQLGLRLNVSLVLEVLAHGFRNKQILSCLQFFDWAGRQPGYSHTRSVFQAIFKILSRAKLTSLMLDFLDTTRYRGNTAVPGYHATLVLGYSVAGKPQRALQMFGKMRFQGLDLDVISYHVLLRSLVEEGCFDAAKEISKQISLRGFENHMTHSILVRSLCKQKMVDEAHSYLRQVIQLGGAKGKGHGDAVGVLVHAFCQKGLFDKAAHVIEEFKELGVVPMEPAYGVWLKNLVQDSKLDGALEFLKSKNSSEGYVPEIFHYNKLLCRLLKENRLTETCDLLLDMMEDGIPPNQITMDTALRFFCKGGMVDVALHLYKYRSEFRLSPSFLSYSYLINSMCEEGYTDEAYNVFKNHADQGYFPTRTFSLLVKSLCRERKLGKLKELMLLIKMQDKGHKATRRQFRAVIRNIFDMPNPESQFLNLFARQISNNACNCEVYNDFIGGAAHAGKPELAREIFELMKRHGIQPNVGSFILVLKSYLKSNRISDALKFFDELRQIMKIGRKLYSRLIIGLSEANREDLALIYFTEMRSKKLVPTNECYEALVQKLCYKKQYDEVVDLVKNFDRDGRHVTSFLGNTLLLHCLKSGELYDAWIRSTEHETSSNLSHLGQLIGVFSGHFGGIQQIDNLEEMIKQCFPLNLYTYNLLLRRLITSQIVDAFELLNRLRQKGFEPNLWSYYILLCGLLKHGRIDEAKRLADEMISKGFDATDHTKQLRKLICSYEQTSMDEIN